MAVQFHAITRDEIHQFLTDLGFQPLILKGVVELVYAKIVQVGTHRLSLRCYTAVNPGGKSRERGKDAIRVQLCHKIRNGERDEIIPVGRAQKCLRVQSWRDNLGKAIDRIAAPDNFRLCPACGHPMVIRQNRATGEGFWGCSQFRITRCKGKHSGPPRQRTLPEVPVEPLTPWEIDDLESDDGADG